MLPHRTHLAYKSNAGPTHVLCIPPAHDLASYCFWKTVWKWSSNQKPPVPLFIPDPRIVRARIPRTECYLPSCLTLAEPPEFRRPDAVAVELYGVPPSIPSYLSHIPAHPHRTHVPNPASCCSSLRSCDCDPDSHGPRHGPKTTGRKRGERQRVRQGLNHHAKED